MTLFVNFYFIQAHLQTLGMKEFGISFQKGDKFSINLGVFEKYNVEFGKKNKKKKHFKVIFFWGLSLCSSTS